MRGEMYKLAIAMRSEIRKVGMLRLLLASLTMIAAAGAFFLLFRASASNGVAALASVPRFLTLLIELVCGLMVILIVLKTFGGLAAERRVACGFVAIGTIIASLLTALPHDRLAPPSFLANVPGRSATLNAEAAVPSASLNGVCTIVRRSAINIVPVPYQRCATRTSQGEVVIFYTKDWGSSSASGFAYSPSGEVVTISDTCVEQMTGRWWRFVGEIPYTAPYPVCPSSFTVDGSG
jgi:hypothetical protein